MVNPQADKRAELISALRQARAGKAPAAEIVALADALKALVPHGEFIPALQEAWPDETHVSQCLTRKRVQARRRASPENAAPICIADDELALYEKLQAIAGEPKERRDRWIAILSSEIGMAERTLYRKMLRARRQGIASLARRPRRDRGNVRLPEEVKQAFLRRRLDTQTRHEQVSISISAVKRDFPDLEISDYSLRRLARSISKAVTMPDQEWRATFEPTGQWEVPHPNHTWALDMTRADLWAWDGDPEVKPYRPWVTAIVDECTSCCMFLLYTKESPSTAILQAVLLHAILEKPSKHWIQCGIPKHLHCDNGKVQESNWLQAVCQAISTDLHLDMDTRHTNVQSPWQQGHIERFFGILHDRFESQLGACYCGNDPKRKPECFVDPSGGPRAWRQYPILESLNEGARIWVTAEYHQLRHRRLKMSRLDYWQLHAGGHIELADRDYLYTALLQRADRGSTRKVVRGKVHVNGYWYWHPRLQGWEEARIEVRWDPADLGRVLVLAHEGQDCFWAERQKVRNVDDPKDLAEHRQQQREIRAARKALKAAAEIAAGDAEKRKEFERVLREEEKKAPIPFPIRAQKKPAAEAEEIPTADEILELHGGADLDDERAEPFSLHGIPI